MGSRVLLDHIHCHDCCDCLLLCRSRDGQEPLEDLPPCWGLGHTRCSSSLHVHARVLGRRWQEPNCVQVHRLEHHCPSTDDRVQPHPKPRKHRLAQLASGNSWLAPFACLPSVTLVRPRQSIHGLASLWVCAAGLSSSSRSLLGNLLRRLAPRPKPSSSLSTTCVSS